MGKIVSKIFSETLSPNGKITTYSKNGKDICSAILKKTEGGRQIIHIKNNNEISKVTDVINHKRHTLVPTKEEAQAFKAMLGII